VSDRRRDELAAALTVVRERIAAAARSAGRDPAEIRLLAVTKTFPASDAALLTDLGVHDLGENREQEAEAKAREVAEERRRASEKAAEKERADAEESAREAELEALKSEEEALDARDEALAERADALALEDKADAAKAERTAED
jgi:hypothetical protein